MENDGLKGLTISASPPLDNIIIIHDLEDQIANQVIVEATSQQPALSPNPPFSTDEEYVSAVASPSADNSQTVDDTKADITISQDHNKVGKKSVLFDTVTVYHFSRSQGFISIPSQGGSTLGMKKRHFLRRKLSVDLYEEVRRRSRREILLKIRFDKNQKKNDDRDQLHCHSISSSTSSTSVTTNSDSDDESFSDYSDISDSELESGSHIFLQPIGVKLRRSLLRASGLGRIDPKEKKDCKSIRDSRDRSGCKCVNQCIPGLCECSLLGVNCHVDRVSFPCGCIADGCQNPNGRTEFDMKRVKVHLYEKLFKIGIG